MSKTAVYTAAIAPGTFGNANYLAQITIDAQGIVTAVSQVPLPNTALATQACIVYSTAASAISAGVVSTFNVVQYDPLSMFNGTNLITIPATGVYRVSHGTSTTLSSIASQIQINAGATNILLISEEPNPGSLAGGSMSIHLTAGDTVRQQCYFGSYTTQTTPFANYIAVVRIA